MADSISVWVPAISTLAGGVLAGGVALLVSRMNHRYAREREAIAADERQRHELSIANDKKARELFFIATELVFLLEEFAESCADVAADTGEYNNDPEPIRQPTVDYPVLSYADVSGDWQVLEPLLMYRVRELIVLRSEAHKAIAYVGENDFPGDYNDYFRERWYQYARLGIRAIIQVRRLRKMAGFPETRLAATPWSAQAVLWEIWRAERRRRAKKAAEYRDLCATEPYEDSI